jgi:hypothetical protein
MEEIRLAPRLEGDEMSYDEHRIAELIAVLPPAPEAWVRAAQELPLVRRGLDDIVERCREDLAYRKRVLADLEAAIAAVGLDPENQVVAELRERLTDR